MPHSFDRFYRVDKARTREEGGSGLGLSIVKEIAEARIGVQSQVGAGTILTVVLKMFFPGNRLRQLRYRIACLISYPAHYHHYFRFNVRDGFNQTPIDLTAFSGVQVPGRLQPKASAAYTISDKVPLTFFVNYERSITKSNVTNTSLNHPAIGDVKMLV